MSAERMKADDSSPPPEAGLSPDLEQVAAELGGMKLAPSRLDRERLFFEAGRASAAETPCECERKLRRERGAWAVVLAASVSLALWAPAAFKPTAAVVERAPPGVQFTVAGPAVVAASHEPTAVGGNEKPAPSPTIEPLKKPISVAAASRRATMAALADAWWGSRDEAPGYVRLRNSVVARGVTVGLANDRNVSGASGDPVAYSDFLKSQADF